MWENIARADQAGYTDPKVSLAAFLATIWAFTALSLLFVPTRLYAHWSALYRLCSDDFLVMFAWTISLAIAVSVTALSNVTYRVMYIGTGRLKGHLPSDVRTITMQFSRLFNIVPMLLIVGLWSIKLAFLLFFRRLGVRSIRALKRWWWVVFTVCLASFCVCFTTLPYHCCFSSFDVVISKECRTQGWSFVSLKLNCALDVFTDCLIMTVPFLILRKTQIPTPQKIALSFIFSLVVITIIFAVIRVAVITSGVQRQIDPTWMFMWSSIELNIAVIIACIAPFRSFFLRSRTSLPKVQGQPQALKRVRETTSESIQIPSSSSSHIAPWQEEIENAIIYPTVVNRPPRPALGVLPDDSGNWSAIAAPWTLSTVDEESGESVIELQDADRPGL